LFTSVYFVIGHSLFGVRYSVENVFLNNEYRIFNIECRRKEISRKYIYGPGIDQPAGWGG